MVGGECGGGGDGGGGGGSGGGAVTSPLTRILAEPKSQSLRTWVSGWTSRFCGLMSRWHTPSEWMYARERQSWYVYSFMYSKGKVFLLFA